MSSKRKIINQIYSFNTSLQAMSLQIVKVCKTTCNKELPLIVT